MLLLLLLLLLLLMISLLCSIFQSTSSTTRTTTSISISSSSIAATTTTSTIMVRGLEVNADGEDATYDDDDDDDDDYGGKEDGDDDEQDYYDDDDDDDYYDAEEDEFASSSRRTMKTTTTTTTTTNDDSAGGGGGGAAQQQKIEDDDDDECGVVVKGTKKGENGECEWLYDNGQVEDEDPMLYELSESTSSPLSYNGVTVSLDDILLQPQPSSSSVSKLDEFKAYIRADISSFYQESFGSRIEIYPQFTGHAGKFINMSPDIVSLYWQNTRPNSEGPTLISGRINPWGSGGTACYPGHIFLITKYNQPAEVICRIRIQQPRKQTGSYPEQFPPISYMSYFCDPYRPNDETNPSQGILVDEERQLRSIDTLSHIDYQKYNEHIYNNQFADIYRNFTGGNIWLTMYPRNKPRHLLWRADYYGQKHVFNTSQTHFIQIPSSNSLHKLSSEQIRNGIDGIHQHSHTLLSSNANNNTHDDEHDHDDHDDDPIEEERNLVEGDDSKNDDGTNLNITLSTSTIPISKNDLVAYPEYRIVRHSMVSMTMTVLSCAPRVLEIPHFLSDIEADHLVMLANRGNLERSTTNGHLSSTRTSRTTWIPRHSDVVVDSIYRRVADALRIDEALLRERGNDEYDFERSTKGRINEDLQVVHYAPGQQYTPHHDFSYPKNDHVDSPSRSINLCMYLNNVDDGGYTSFPRWRNGHTNQPLLVKPQKGKGVIFYMINPDGNLDELAQHAGTPVISGEKYFANLWIWDPIRK